MPDCANALIDGKRVRLRQQLVDEETGSVVDAEHKGRDYELSKGRYVPIDEDTFRGWGLDEKLKSKSHVVQRYELFGHVGSGSS